jgi:hypothetical protein
MLNYKGYWDTHIFQSVTNGSLKIIHKNFNLTHTKFNKDIKQTLVEAREVEGKYQGHRIGIQIGTKKKVSS